MYFAQLDGQLTNKQSQDLLDQELKKAKQLEKENKQSKSQDN